MFRFFKQIRGVLLEDQQFRKYVIYATGEILLVMIGILLALQVSNWNQDRMEVEYETYMLESVTESLKEDSLLFIQVQNSLATVEQLHRDIYHITTGDLSPDSLDNLRWIRRNILFNPVTMINYPDLANELGDPELTQAVRVYYQRLDDTYYVIDNFNAHLEDILRPFLGELEIYNFGYQYQGEATDVINRDGIILKDRFIEELENPALRQMLFETGLKFYGSQFVLSQLQAENVKIMDQINSYLNY